MLVVASFLFHMFFPYIGFMLLCESLVHVMLNAFLSLPLFTTIANVKSLAFHCFFADEYLWFAVTLCDWG